MGLFTSAKSAQIKALSGQLAAMQDLVTQRINTINNSLRIYPTFKSLENADRYCTTDDVYSIVRLLSTTAAMIPLYTYLVKNDKAAKKLKHLQPDARMMNRKYLEIKALEEAPETDPVEKLLQYPCYGKTSFEFLESVYATMLIQGECILWKEIPEVGPNAGKVTQLHLLNPQYVNIKITDTFPYTIVSYQYLVDGRMILDDIPAAEIIHIKYFNPKIGINGDGLRGLSPLRVLSNRLTRVDSNMSASVAQLQNGGVPGIVYEKGYPDGAVDVVGNRKDNFFKYLTESENKGAPYFSAGDMGYIELGLKLADLEVAELGKIDFKKMCNAFGVSDILFNNDAGSTDNNVNVQTKRLYTNTILPNIFRVRDSLNMGLTPHFKDAKRFINFDISEIPELQENYKDMVAWMQQAWWITPNEKREMMKFEESDEPLFETYLLPTGLQTIEDLSSPILPPTKDYGFGK